MITPRIWNALPGNRWVKTAITVVTLAAVVLVLFEWVFPWVSTLIPYQEQTVE